MVAFDIGNLSSYITAKLWIDERVNKNNQNPHLLTYLVGCKSDNALREVNRDTISKEIP